jgi:cytosine/adenosine deaminase-related metal-dependent hydrolase
VKKKFCLPPANAHTHAAMAGFRGMAEDAPLQKRLNDYFSGGVSIAPIKEMIYYSDIQK